MAAYRRAKQTIPGSPGESVRILRELQEMSQNELAEASGIRPAGAARPPLCRIADTPEPPIAP